LNSFYKGSKESSISDINTGSNISFNTNQPPIYRTWNTIQNKPFVKDNILGLPNKKPNHKTAEGKRRSISLNIALVNELSSNQNGGEGYKIHISAIGKLFPIRDGLS